jgi:hypothetical protein
MKTKHLPNYLIRFVVLSAACIPAYADWKVHPKSEFDKEVRVWASTKEGGVDFSWSGKVNARHEAEGYGVLGWHKTGEQELRSEYRGEFKAGRRHGTGVSLQRSGAKYSGQWEQDAREGKGEYWYSNGDYYAGTFHNDVKHGPGRYVSADGNVFEGNFSDDEREGPGVVVFPDGRRYASKWVAGKDTNPAGTPVPEKPYLMIGTDVRPYALDGKIFGGPGSEVGTDCYLTYRGRWTDGTLAIDPDWPYWVAWSKGGPVGDNEGFYYGVGTHPAYVELRLVNPGREKLEIRRAEVVVSESHQDLEPILDIRDESESGGVTCSIGNFSANRVLDCEVAFNILPPAGRPKFEKFDFVERIGPFSKSATFSLTRAMGVLGIDAAAIAAVEKKMHDDEPLGDALKRRIRRELGKVPQFVEEGDAKKFSAYAMIAGEIRLAWMDHLGAKQSKHVKFQFRKCFVDFAQENGALGPASGKYDVILQPAGKGYVVPFTYKRSVTPGGNDRFTLRVASEVSAYHSFSIRLTTTDGREILSPPCRLHFLVPRNFSWKAGYVIRDP